MRIGICDDEKNIRELIADKVIKQCPDADIIFFSSGEEVLMSDANIDILYDDESIYNISDFKNKKPKISRKNIFTPH